MELERSGKPTDTVRIEGTARKVVIVRVKRIKRQKKGVGGFMEALLALMVITVGVLMITSSLTLSSQGLTERREDLSDCGERLMDRILTDPELTAHGSIRYAALRDCRPERLSVEGVQGFRIALIELSGETSSPLQLSYGASSHPEDDPFVRSVPVNSYHGPRDIRAALLLVWVW
jgi:hypothetical protein